MHTFGLCVDNGHHSGLRGTHQRGLVHVSAHHGRCQKAGPIGTLLLIRTQWGPCECMHGDSNVVMRTKTICTHVFTVFAVKHLAMFWHPSGALRSRGAGNAGAAFAGCLLCRCQDAATPPSDDGAHCGWGSRGHWGAGLGLRGGRRRQLATCGSQPCLDIIQQIRTQCASVLGLKISELHRAVLCHKASDVHGVCGCP